jgi:catechol 2,3-dioxygenase-like lactoylglutathione lyase family enzyme
VIVERTDLVSVPVTDLGRSTGFYRDTLGLEEHGDVVDSGACHTAHFADPDGNVFMLHRRYAP